MELNELPPKEGFQREYCDRCSGPLDLVFERFHEHVSGVEIDVDDLPSLRVAYLPDRTRFHHGVPLESQDRLSPTKSYEYTISMNRDYGS